MRMPSASQVQRAMLCAASQVLPRINRSSSYAERGTAIHDYVARYFTSGKRLALELVPEEHRAICESLDIAGLVDLLGGHPEMETAFVYDIKADTAKRLGTNIGRDYGPLSDVEVAGTVDLLTVFDDHVAISDMKTGHYIGPAAESWQLKTLALAASRHYRKEEVRATLIRLKDDGDFYYSPTVTWDAFDLDGFAGELQSLYVRVKAARAQHEKGTVDVYPSDDACQFCACKEYCPAWTRAALTVVKQEIAPTGDLTDGDLAALWSTLKRAEKYIEAAKSAIRARVEREPLPLPNGKRVQLVDSPRESIDPTIAWGVLANKYGTELATKAVEQSATKASIKRALNGHHEEAIEAIREAGGVKVTVTSSPKEV